MGDTLRVMHLRSIEAAQRLEHRLRAGASAAKELARFRESWLDRDRAAAALGIRPRTLKQWQLEARGPSPVKAGEHRQSRCLWSRSEIDAFLRDPAGYEALKHAPAIRPTSEGRDSKIT